MDKMIDISQSMIDRAALARLWKEMFKVIVNDNPYLFLYIPNTITTVDKNIKNIEPSLSGIWHNHILWEKDTVK